MLINGSQGNFLFLKGYSCQVHNEIVVNDNSRFYDVFLLVFFNHFIFCDADGFLFYADGRKIQYNVLHQPDPTEVLEGD